MLIKNYIVQRFVEECPLVITRPFAKKLPMEDVVELNRIIQLEMVGSVA